MKSRSSGCVNGLAVFLFILLCISMAGVGWGITRLPQRAAKDFGPINPSLSFFNQIVYSLRLYWNWDDVMKPAGDDLQVVFEIEEGETVKSIASRLQSAYVIREADIFELYLIYSGLDTSVQVGKFKLNSKMNVMQVAQSLQDATPSDVDFSILSGWRLEEIANSLPTSGLSISSEQFLAIAKNPAGVKLPDWFEDISTLEGYLLPGVYSMPRALNANQLLDTLLRQFENALSAEMVAGFERQGLSIEQAIILASIVEREAVVSEEKPLIASVFLNRLNANIKLDSDPTVQYAVGYNETQKTWWTNPLSYADLQINSPFNTYLYPGLPPHPICNPSVSALNAVAFPAQTPYYYFRAQCDGSGKHFFSVTYEEHLKNACP